MEVLIMNHRFGHYNEIIIVKMIGKVCMFVTLKNGLKARTRPELVKFSDRFALSWEIFR